MKLWEKAPLSLSFSLFVLRLVPSSCSCSCELISASTMVILAVSHTGGEKLSSHYVEYMKEKDERCRSNCARYIYIYNIILSLDRFNEIKHRLLLQVSILWKFDHSSSWLNYYLWNFAWNLLSTPPLHMRNFLISKIPNWFKSMILETDSSLLIK